MGSKRIGEKDKDIKIMAKRNHSEDITPEKKMKLCDDAVTSSLQRLPTPRIDTHAIIAKHTSDVTPKRESTRKYRKAKETSSEELKTLSCSKALFSDNSDDEKDSGVADIQ